MPVQWVNRPDLDFRGFSGQIVGGTVRPGDRGPRRCPRARTVHRRAHRHLRRRPRRGRRRPVGHPHPRRRDRHQPRRRHRPAAAPPEVADQFEAHIVWMADEEMLPGRPLPAQDRHPARSARRSPQPKYKVNVNTLEHTAAKTLELNEIGVCNLSLDRPVAVRPLRRQPRHGRLHPDRPADQRHRRRRHAPLRAPPRRQRPLAGDRGRQERARRAQGPAARRCVWFTGLSGAGKSTIANLVERKLHAAGGTPTCSTATTSVTASTATSASPTPTGSRTSAASPRSPG